MSFHKDIPDPDGTGPEYSKPGDPLWVQKFLPGSFMAYRYMEGILEGWLDPPTMTYIFPADTVCWMYHFYIDRDAFVQQGTLDEPVVYWLDVQADPYDPEARFGWKTSGKSTGTMTPSGARVESRIWVRGMS